MKSSKGSIEVVSTLVLIMIMIGIFAIVVSAALSSSERIQRIVFDESLSLKTRNILELTEKSLDSTWLVSTIQIVFKSADLSVNCGIDDSLEDRYGLKEYYWYQYNPRKDIHFGRDGLKTSSCVDTDSCGDSIDYPPRLPETDKYNSNENDYNPRICYPRTNHLLDYINSQEDLFKSINTSFSIDAVDISLNDIDFDFSIDENKITNDVTQNIYAGFSTVTVNKAYESDIIVDTELNKQLAAGRQIIRDILELSDKLTYDTTPEYPDTLFDFSIRYQDFDESDFVKTKNATEYKEKISDYIEDKLVDSESLLEKSRIGVSYDKFELIVPTEQTIGIWPSGTYEPKVGLVLHYDGTVKISEGIGSDTNACNKEPDQNYVNYIVAAVDDNDWSFDNDIDFEKSEIEKLVKATIQEESKWNPEARSPAGAIGIMQIMPATALDSCADEEHGAISNEDDLLDAEKNIKCGVHIINLNMRFFDAPQNKEDLMKLAAAQYNCGCLSSGATNYENIYKQLPLETQEYVPRVLGHYICYGGFLESFGGVYYYFDEKNRDFFQRPVTLQFKFEDYLPAIECFRTPYSGNLVTRFHINPETASSLVDLICCRQEGINVLYSCGYEIEGLGDNNILNPAAVSCGDESTSYSANCDGISFNIQQI